MPVGVTAVIVVAFTTTKLATATLPTFTLVAFVRYVPVNVIAVPPVVGPLLGVTSEIVGSGVIKVNAFVSVPVPPEVVTVTL